MLTYRVYFTLQHRGAYAPIGSTHSDSREFEAEDDDAARAEVAARWPNRPISGTRPGLHVTGLVRLVQKEVQERI